MIKKVNDRIEVVFTEDGFLFGNAILVKDDINLMIDSGVGTIIESIDKASIDVLAISHCHLDHINGNDLFPNAVIKAHPLEKIAMQSPPKVTATEFWDELMGDDGQKPSEIFTQFNPRYYKPWNVDEELHDNQIIDCGNTEVMVVLTPGHTKGHCSYYFPREEFMFIGDICLTRVGPWYGDLDATIDDFIASVDRIIEIKPKILTTAHVRTLITEDIETKLVRYRDRIYQREEKILSFLSKTAANIDEMAKHHLIYKMHPSSFVLFWEKCMLKQHLRRLKDQDMIEETEDRRYRARLANTRPGTFFGGGC